MTDAQKSPDMGAVYFDEQIATYDVTPEEFWHWATHRQIVTFDIAEPRSCEVQKLLGMVEGCHMGVGQSQLLHIAAESTPQLDSSRRRQQCCEAGVQCWLC